MVAGQDVRRDRTWYSDRTVSEPASLAVEDQTEVEIRSHRAMAAHLAYYRENAPGFESASNGA